MATQQNCPLLTEPTSPDPEYSKTSDNSPSTLINGQQGPPTTRLPDAIYMAKPDAMPAMLGNRRDETSRQCSGISLGLMA